MSEQNWNAIDAYICDRLVAPDPALAAALAASEAAGLPPHHVAPSQGKLLYLLARLAQARRILEIGTLGGYSTIWLARALPADGCLVTLEADPRHAEIARGNIARAGLAERVELRLGPALETLPRLAAEGSDPFDLVFIDADKPSNPDYLAWALALARPGTLIIGDNVVRAGAVANGASDDPRVQGVRRFFDMLGQEKRLEATAIQTVGSKGYDGFAIALVTGDSALPRSHPHIPASRRHVREKRASMVRLPWVPAFAGKTNSEETSLASAHETLRRRCA